MKKSILITLCILITFKVYAGKSIANFTDKQLALKTDTGLKFSKILILGNSITYHSPNPSIGWHGSWGMAATSLDNDYAHQLLHLADPSGKAKVLIDNVVESFEKPFPKFDSTKFTKYQQFSANLIIIKLGENIPYGAIDSSSVINDYSQLINYLAKSNNAAVSVCIVGSFWPNDKLDKYLSSLCLKKNWTFVSLKGISLDALNKASGFENKGINNHPSDLGMKEIANRIWQAIKLVKN